MKNLPLACLTSALLLTLIVFSQDTLYNSGSGFGKKSLFYSAPYFEGNEFFAAVTEKGQVHRSIYSTETGKPITSFSTPAATNTHFYTLESPIIASAIGSGKVTNMVYDPVNNKLLVETVDFANKTAGVSDALEIGKKNHFIGVTRIGDQFIAASHPFKQNKIVLHTWKAGAGFISKEFLFPAKNDADKVLLSTALADAKIIDGASRAEIASLAAKAKLFISPTKLMILSTHDYNFTKVLSCDLASGQTSVKEYPTPESKKKNALEPALSSFIYNNHLIQACVYTDQLIIRFVDLETNASVKELVADQDDPIPFRNTNFKQVSSSSIHYFPVERDFDFSKTSRFIRKVRNTGLALGLHDAASGDVEMIVGSYKLVEPRDFMDPNTGIMSSTAGSEKTVYFRSRLSKPHFEHIPGDIPFTQREKREAYEDQVKRKNSMSAFRSEINEYLGYYDMETGGIVIVVFSQAEKQ